MIGNQCIRTYSTTLDTIALSSGEAEYCGLVRVAGHATGIRSVLSDIDLNYEIRLLTDGSAAKGTASRRGAGKIRHGEVNQLWLQEKITNGEITVNKVNSNENIAAMFHTY